jgi:hypothetical protein
MDTQETKNSGAVGLLGSIGRMIICVISAGFVYPNAFIEGIDTTKIQAETQGDLYKKK